MSHEIEIIDGKAAMAYAGAVPWHGLGTKVPSDLTPIQMLEAAGLDWKVEKSQAYVVVDDEVQLIDRAALIRSSDKKVLDVVTNDWNPVQNETAFEFFNEFIATGDMEMHTAGSLHGGQIVWALAKTKDSFELFGGDRIDSYMLFTNFHRYGCAIDNRFTPVRVVCNNTIQIALAAYDNDRIFKSSHRREYIPTLAKKALGIATDGMKSYKERAEFLGSRQAKGEDIVDYFNRIFPMNSDGDSEKVRRKDVSKNASRARAILETQPGHEFAAGTWWQPFNAVTYLVDHVMGRSDDTRMTSAWYGANRTLKNRALTEALAMADAS
jgi:phage/plasmid-like protein (TIGR03299 family)